MFDVQRWVVASACVAVIFPVPMNLLINLLLALYVLVALLMMLVILMQRPKSEGLGAAFGGGVTENIFGAQTTNVLVKFTAWMAGIFFALTFALSILYAHKNAAGDSAFRRELMKTQAAPQTSPAPTTAAQASPNSSPAPASGAGVSDTGSTTPVAAPESPNPVAAPSVSASVAPSVSPTAPTDGKGKQKR
jgi:preprotein translocase subunit SecG